MPQIDVWYDRIEVEQLHQYAKKENEEALDQLIESRARKAHQSWCVEEAHHDWSKVDGGSPKIRHTGPIGSATPPRQILQSVLAEYHKSVPDHLENLLTRYDAVDAVRQVVGVGSVGMRVFLTLLEERRSGDPLFLQIKQAGPSVYEQFLGKSKYENHGARVVQGQHLIQSATDMFVGWTTFQYSPIGSGSGLLRPAVPGRQGHPEG